MKKKMKEIDRDWQYVTLGSFLKQDMVLWWSSCGVLGGESEDDELEKEKKKMGSWRRNEE